MEWDIPETYDIWLISITGIIDEVSVCEMLQFILIEMSRIFRDPMCE